MENQAEKSVCYKCPICDKGYTLTLTPEQQEDLQRKAREHKDLRFKLDAKDLDSVYLRAMTAVDYFEHKHNTPEGEKHKVKVYLSMTYNIVDVTK
jgi:hypothetical protein